MEARGRGCPVPREGVESEGGAADLAEGVPGNLDEEGKAFNGWNTMP